MFDIEILDIVEDGDVLGIGGHRRGILVIGVHSRVAIEALRRLRWHCDFGHVESDVMDW